MELSRDKVYHISKEVEQDAKKISEYLGINCPKIELVEDSYEGLTLDKKTFLGIEGGYRRKLLIHELLHTKGFSHTYPSNFFAAAGKIDELSEFVERQVFQENQQEVK